jgi:carbamoyltransferase
MEFGPRALGNRSILGDPRRSDMQKKLNLKIKYREGFRPFAPSVLAEESHHYFDLKSPSPYMLLVAPVKEGRRDPLPPGYHSLPLYDRLYHRRSDIPAITHIDYSARIQTVHKGYGLLVNTSFNVRGEPIVCTPDDAYRCFMRTEMDDLVMEDFLFEKEKQPPWREEGNWREKYGLD